MQGIQSHVVCDDFGLRERITNVAYRSMLLKPRPNSTCIPPKILPLFFGKLGYNEYFIEAGSIKQTAIGFVTFLSFNLFQFNTYA